MSAHRGTAALAALALVTGCSVGPDYRAPKPTMPATYSAAAKTNGLTNDPSARLENWWTVFHDNQLSTLIRTAQESNLDLRSAAARVREARALQGITRAPWYPQVGATGDYARARVSKNSLLGGQLAVQNRPLQNNLFDAALDMNWELDVFGGTRRAVEAAGAEFDAARESAQAVMVTMLAEVGLTYLDLRGAQQEIMLTQENLQTQQDTLALTKDRFHSGLAGEPDVARATEDVAATRARIPPLEEAAERARNRLAVLLGKNPGELAAPLGESAPIPAAAPRVPLGIPADLLRQRPDIRRAERQIAAANAQVGVATADWFPKFYLTGAAGLQSVEASDFLGGSSRYWSLGPSIRWPVFAGGRIRQNIRVQNTRQEQAALAYEQVVLTALEEVQNALVAFGQEQQRHAALAEAVTASRRSFALAQDRYRAGLVDFLVVLEAQRSLLVTQDQMVQSERQLSQNLIRVYKSLGGGWQPTQIASR